MRVPPFEVFTFNLEKKEEKIKIFFLSEGTNSERYFYKHLFSNPAYGFVIPDNIILNEVKKTDIDKGLSDGLALVKKAIEWCNDPGNSFDKNRDKMVVTFDLDRLSNENIAELISLKEPYLFYGFSNPKFEVVQLLSCIEDLTEVEEKYNSSSFPNTILENMFSSLTHVSSKNKNSGLCVAKNYKSLIEHRKYDESNIELAKGKFCTNVLNILEIISKM